MHRYPGFDKHTSRYPIRYVRQQGIVPPSHNGLQHNPEEGMNERAPLSVGMFGRGFDIGRPQGSVWSPCTLYQGMVGQYRFSHHGVCLFSGSPYPEILGNQLEKTLSGSWNNQPFFFSRIPATLFSLRSACKRFPGVV